MNEDTPMESNGIMQEIGEQLAQGKSSSDIIGSGYAPRNVYKAQRQVRITKS